MIEYFETYFRIEKLESKLSYCSNPYSAEPRSNDDTQSVYESINSCDLYSNEYLELDDVSRHVYSNIKTDNRGTFISKLFIIFSKQVCQ